ncbi:MAG: hypothetical protein H6622_11690 [Halobacteriovoraceae bacterium]|nr:hypothetical protein [Halobacteriovoraceae bacterium]
MNIVFLILIVFSISSCDSLPEINCSDSNLPKLVNISEQYILSHTLSDKKSQKINFKSFEIRKNSCVENKRKKKVAFQLDVVADDQGEIKNVQFTCQFGQINTDKENDILCQMI